MAPKARQIWPTAVEPIAMGEADFAPLYPDEMPLFEKIETIAKGSTARRGDRGQEDPRPAEAVGGAGLWQPSGLHGEDPV